MTPDPEHPVVPVNDDEVRAALQSSGVDMTGTSRGPSGNSHIANPAVNSSLLARYASSMSQPQDVPTIAFDAVPRGGGVSKTDATVAARFAEWQERRSKVDDERVAIRKAMDALHGIQQSEIDRERAKRDKKTALRTMRDADPHLREDHAKKKSLKAMRKHLASGHNVPDTLSRGFASYREHGGTASFASFQKHLRTGA